MRLSVQVAVGVGSRPSTTGDRSRPGASPATIAVPGFGALWRLSVHRRGPLFRPLVGLVLAGSVVLVCVGGLALRGPGLIAVAAAGVLAGCLAAGMAREQPERDRWGMVEAAVLAAGWTMGGLLMLYGAAALFGSGPTAVVAGLAGAVAAVLLIMRLTRSGHPMVGPSPA